MNFNGSMSTSVSARPDTTGTEASAKRPTTPVPTRLKVRRTLFEFGPLLQTQSEARHLLMQRFEVSCQAREIQAGGQR